MATKKYRDSHQKEIKAYYEANKEKLREYQRNYRRTHKAQYNTHNRIYRARHPDKIHAENLAYYRIPLGTSCEQCGSTTKLLRHHPDYTRPFEIVTLCQPCHFTVHGEF